VATYTSSSSLAAGDHTILASYVGDSTYAASSLSLTQTVNQVTPVVTWSNPADITYGTALSGTQLNATSLTLAGTASSGLAVSYASSAPAIASVSGSTLTLHQGGSVTLTDSQTGGANYTAATAVARTLNITGFAAMDDAVSRPANSSGIKIPVATLLANDG